MLQFGDEQLRFDIKSTGIIANLECRESALPVLYLADYGTDKAHRPGNLVLRKPHFVAKCS